MQIALVCPATFNCLLLTLVEFFFSNNFPSLSLHLLVDYAKQSMWITIIWSSHLCFHCVHLDSNYEMEYLQLRNKNETNDGYRTRMKWLWFACGSHANGKQTFRFRVWKIIVDNVFISFSLSISFYFFVRIITITPWLHSFFT